jgi:hypothetical protein
MSKMSSSKEREIAAGVYLSEACKNPLHTVYSTFIQYIYSHREGGGE